MSIALVVTRGFGNGTLEGSIKDVVTSGYTVGIVASYTFLGTGTFAYSYLEDYYALN